MSALRCIICLKTFGDVTVLATRDPNQPVTAVMCFPCSFRRLRQGLIPLGEEHDFLEGQMEIIRGFEVDSQRAWGVID